MSWFKIVLGVKFLYPVYIFQTGSRFSNQFEFLKTVFVINCQKRGFSILGV